jgi:hypothetical protein
MHLARFIFRPFLISPVIRRNSEASESGPDAAVGVDELEGRGDAPYRQSRFKPACRFDRDE